MPNPYRRAPAVRFVCAGCRLSLPRRYAAARPDGAEPLRCLRCAFVLATRDAGVREALRSLLARSAPHRRGEP